MISSDPRERMRLVRQFLKDGFDVDAYGLWHPSLIDTLDVCDAAVVDTESYAQVLLATTEIPDTMDPPRCVVIANDDRIADRLRRALKLEIFIRPVNPNEVSTVLRRLCYTPGIEGLGASISDPIEQALMRWATEERTIAVEGRWRHERGTIYVDGGEIFHARAGSDVGERALDRMFYWPEDERRFWTLTALRPQKQTIYGDPELALLDAGHRAREIESRVDALGGLDSVWTFDWREFQNQEDELSYSVDQLLPWLEGTDYLAKKIFVADAELSTTLRVVEDLIACGVLKPQSVGDRPSPQSRRRRGNDRADGSTGAGFGAEGSFADEHDRLTPTLAEERLPTMEGRFRAADFSDRTSDEPLAPLLEEKEGILAETDRLRAQLAALEAEKRAYGDVDEQAVGAPDDRSDRATRLFWRQVAFEQHARLALNKLKQRNRRIDGRGADAESFGTSESNRLMLGDDSGLFAIAEEASVFAHELRVAAGTMRGEAPRMPEATKANDRSYRSERGRDASSGADTGTDRFGFADLERSRTELFASTATNTQSVGDDSAPQSAEDTTPSHADSSTGDNRTITAPRVNPSGSYAALPNVEAAFRRRPVTEPRSRPSGSFQPLKAVVFEADDVSVATESDRDSVSPRPDHDPAVAKGKRDPVADNDFLRTEIPYDAEGDQVGSSSDLSVQSELPGAQDGAFDTSSQGRAKPPPPPRGMGDAFRNSEVSPDEAGFSDSFDEEDVGIFPDSYDEALELALNELFEDPPFTEPPLAFDEFDRRKTESVLEDSAATHRREISDIWLPPDALERPGELKAAGEGARKQENTEQQPITMVRQDGDDGKDLKFVHSFPSSEVESVSDSHNERVPDQKTESGSEQPAPDGQSDGAKPFGRYGERRGTGPTNTLLLSAVPAPHELREMAEEWSASGADPYRYDDFEEEDTPVAGVERVSEVVLGNSGFRDPHISDRTRVVTADVDELEELGDDVEKREDDTVDLPGGSALLKLIDAESERVASGPASQGFEGGSASQDQDTTSGDLSVHEPRPYVWVIAILMLLASILILMMSNEEPPDVDSTNASAVGGIEEMVAGPFGVILAPSDSEELPANVATLEVSELEFGIAHGGEIARDVRQSAAQMIETAGNNP